LQTFGKTKPYGRNVLTILLNQTKLLHHGVGAMCTLIKDNCTLIITEALEFGHKHTDML